MRFTLSLALVVGALAVTERARADVSSWAYVGFGPALVEQDANRDELWSLDISAGIGTPPGPFVLGGLFRVQPYFGEGTDLALLVRGATRGFVQGGFGIAVDAGGYQRLWNGGSTGGTVALVLGAPWGITLNASGGIGTNDVRFGGVTLGLDFARLTVYRTHGTSWFLNPFVTDEHGRGPR
nr:MAG: hypothetical protein DIU78_11305 [Pseudomonadota bacterium]